MNLYVHIDYVFSFSVVSILNFLLLFIRGGLLTLYLYGLLSSPFNLVWPLLDIKLLIFISFLIYSMLLLIEVNMSGLHNPVLPDIKNETHYMSQFYEYILQWIISHRMSMSHAIMSPISSIFSEFEIC